MAVSIEGEQEEIALRSLDSDNPEAGVPVEDSNRTMKCCDHVLECVFGNIVPNSEREDYIANYSFWPPPVVIPILTVTQIAVFIYYAVKLENEGHQVTASEGLDYESPIMYNPSKRHEVWRFVTYMFIHQGWAHILINSIVQLIFGLPLEMLHKSWRVTVVYIMGVISGSLAHSLTDHSVSLVGASGGGYALMGAHIAAVITNWKEMSYECRKENLCRILLLGAPVRLALMFTIVFAGFGLAIYQRFTGTEVQRIGIAAHVGGLLSGLFLGLKVLKNLNILKWESILSWIALAFFLVAFVVAIFFNIFYKGYPETKWD